MTAEFPGVLRDLFKLSLEQAQRVFETFITTSEGTWRGIRAGSQTGAGMGALMDKVAEITRANAEASFSFALKLAESEETNQAMKVCEEYARKQMEAFARQFEEMRDLTSQIFRDSNRDQSGVSGSRAANSDTPAPKSPPRKVSDAPTLGVSDLQSGVGDEEKRSHETGLKKSQRRDQRSQMVEAPAVPTNVLANHSSTSVSGDKSTFQPTTGKPFPLERHAHQNEESSDHRPSGRRKSVRNDLKKEKASRPGKKGKRHHDKA
jgi:hypothetical protein